MSAPAPRLAATRAALGRQWAETAVRWQRLAPRERRLLAIAGAVGAAALVYLVLVEPAWTQYRRLQNDLPLLRTQAATVDALVREAQGMQRTVAGRMTPAQTRQALEDSLRSSGIEAKVEEAATTDDTPPPAGSLQVTVDQVSAPALLQWLESVPALTRLSLRALALERPSDDNGRLMIGKASGQLLLSPSTTEPH